MKFTTNSLCELVIVKRHIEFDLCNYFMIDVFYITPIYSHTRLSFISKDQVCVKIKTALYLLYNYIHIHKLYNILYI